MEMPLRRGFYAAPIERNAVVQAKGDVVAIPFCDPDPSSYRHIVSLKVLAGCKRNLLEKDSRQILAAFRQKKGPVAKWSLGSHAAGSSWLGVTVPQRGLSRPPKTQSQHSHHQ
jgi:hypothetical protein